MRQNLPALLAESLRILAHAQNHADLNASESYCRDIPAGHPTRYAKAHTIAHDLARIRNELRHLSDQTTGACALQPAHGALPADSAERPAAVDPVRSAGCELVHTSGSTVSGGHD